MALALPYMSVHSSGETPLLCREQLARLSVHVEIASRINREIDDRALIVLGKLEQDLVFGDATSKEVIQFLQDHAAIPANDKVPLFTLVFHCAGRVCMCRAPLCKAYETKPGDPHAVVAVMPFQGLLF